jgi:hypothetical protein
LETDRQDGSSSVCLVGVDSAEQGHATTAIRHGFNQESFVACMDQSVATISGNATTRTNTSPADAAVRNHHATKPIVSAVLDWELCSFQGDPLANLSLLYRIPHGLPGSAA